MAPDNSNPLLEIFIFETSQLLEQIEEIMLTSERANALAPESINEIFRAMHTIKGSAAMMAYDGISHLSHAVEDMFYFIRENKSVSVAYSDICDFVLQASDFIKGEIAKIMSGIQPDGKPEALTGLIHGYLDNLKSGVHAAPPKAEAPKPASAPPEAKAPEDKDLPVLEEGIFRYTAHVTFDENCQMENIRAFGLIHNMKDLCIDLTHQPEELLEDDSTADIIARDGFSLCFTSKEDKACFEHVFDQTMFLKTFTLGVEGEAAVALFEPVAAAEEIIAAEVLQDIAPDETGTVHDDAQDKKGILLKSVKQSQISVNIAKLDSLMDLVGEIVISEAMVTHNPDLSGLQLAGFQKAARQLRKLTDELQDLVMSVRMIPVANTFHKMTRIVRDMGKKLDKDAELAILGEDTEVDKNIIDNLSDPLMHLIRNAMDHGLETREERRALGKPEEGRITLEAVNTGGDVLITIHDDGRGLDREKILTRARVNNLLPKAESDMTDRDVFSLILLPGFSTKEEVTEFSGRGVGMDVVKKNIEKVGGSVSIESVLGRGMTVSIKIPLTLAIIDGMLFAVGGSVFTLPTTSIKEVFRPGEQTLVADTDGHEMIMLRGQCLPVIRLHKAFGVETEVTELSHGIMLEVESNEGTLCLFADRLIGEQQVVVKPLPHFLSRFGVKEKAGIGGCTILGDGSISLILDTSEISRSMM
jgi:two-component system, chemotaxis family, sensor kinase CheA